MSAELESAKAPDGKRQDRAIGLAIALLLLSFYLSTTSLRFHMIDEVAVFSTGRSLASHGTLDSDAIYWTKAALGTGSIIAEGIDGHYYSTKDLAPLVLVAPFLWIAHHVGASPVRASMLLMPLVTASTGALLYHFVRSWGYPVRTATLSALTYGLGSFAWVYATMLFTQTVAAFGLLLAFSMVVRAENNQDWRAAFGGGLGMALAGMSAAPTWMVCPLLMIYLVPWNELCSQKRPPPMRKLSLILAFGAVVGTALSGQALYNGIRFGSALATGHQQFGGATVDIRYLPLGLFGQLISTPRGIFWFVPYLLLIPAGIVLGWHKHKHALLLASGQAVLVLLVYSIYYTWWAGHVWGPRYLLPVMPCLTLLAVPALDQIWDNRYGWQRWLISVLLLLSVVTQIAAVLFDYLYTEIDIAEKLHVIEPSLAFLSTAPVLTDFLALPLVRQFAAASAHQWDVLWMLDGKLDPMLLAACLILIAVAGSSYLLVLKRGSRVAVAVPSILAIVVVSLMLSRYPEGPEMVPDLDTVVASLHATGATGDAVLAIVPYSAFDWLDSYDGRLPDIGLVFENPLSTETESLLARTLACHPRIWIVSEGTFPGDPANGAQRWMSDHAFVGTESRIGGYRIVSYSVWQKPLHETTVNIPFGADNILLNSYAVETTGTGSTRWINVQLVWKASATPTTDYTVFLHLLDPDGVLVAQHDGIPQAGYAPTSTWEPTIRIIDQHSLLLPESLPPGTYVLEVGLYDPLTGERLALASGGESVPLETIQILSDPGTASP